MHEVCQGDAQLTQPTPGTWSLQVHSDGTRYSNAQLDDYHHRARAHYPWRPPVRLRLQARLQGDLRGTFGFGFWNAPYSPLASRSIALPASAWFFGNGMGNLAWMPASHATGFKAATLNTRRPQALALAPLSPLLMLANRWPRWYASVWPRLQPALGLSEHMLAVDTVWHDYQLDWTPHGLQWWVDGVRVHQVAGAPSGPLGLCIWIDNQWLTATPTGKFGWGLTATHSQLDVRAVEVIPNA
jgi:hypothetical protein